MSDTHAHDFDPAEDFEFELDVSKQFDFDLSMDFDTKVDYESDFEAHGNVDVDVDIKENFAGFNVDVQAVGPDTAVETNLAVVVTDHYSSIALSGYSATGTKVDPEPQNAVPNAVNDTVYLELGDLKTISALANDTDSDGSIVPSSVQITTAPMLGSAVANANGTITYDDAITNTPADNSAVDTLTYQISDNGGGTDQASVTINIIDPLVEVSSDMDAGPNGQALGLTLTTEDRTANTTSFVNVGLQSGDLPSAAINVAFIYDASGSVSLAQYVQEIQAVQNTIDALREEYAGASNTISVQLIRFSVGSDNSTTYDLYNSALNDISQLAITDYSNGGGTNYEAALQDALAFFASADPSNTEDNYVLFASDGMPNIGSHADEASALKAISSISAVGFGAGINTATLDQLDNTGGSQVVGTAADLGDVFANSPLFGAELVSFGLTLSVDGGPATLIADQDDLTSLGGGDYSLNLASVAGLTGILGQSNIFTATAVFDTDNDTGTTADRVTLSTVNTVQGAVPELFWV
ncbi:VWA domain-containing protein [Aquabacter sp. CN5-332]|uniref:Ig-like domain-containing protein n=1 Tax=Aquabacter sp. CN5-332 TaxID=3156608 RepID=UPI0032B59555